VKSLAKNDSQLDGDNMLNKIEQMLIEHSKSFKNMSPAELAQAEIQLQRIEEALADVVFPRLLDSSERENPAYLALNTNFEKDAVRTKDIA
jgi:hypothetical protein